MLQPESILLAIPVVYLANLSSIPRPPHLVVHPLPLHLSPLQYTLQEKRDSESLPWTAKVSAKRERIYNVDVLVETTSPDVIIATETWLNSEIKSSVFYSSLGYNIYRNDRNSEAYGGVLVAIKNI